MGLLQPDDLTVDRANEMCENYPKLKEQNYLFQFRHEMHIEMVNWLADMLVDNLHCAKCPVKSCGMILDGKCAEKIKRILSKRANRKITKKYDKENKLTPRRKD